MQFLEAETVATTIAEKNNGFKRSVTLPGLHIDTTLSSWDNFLRRI